METSDDVGRSVGKRHQGQGHGHGHGHGQDRDQVMEALERELSLLFRRARSSSGEMAREVHPDLEPAAYGILSRLHETGPERATLLAGFFGVGKATMSRQLRALEDLGLVRREPDPADGRAFLVQLTEEGRSRFSHVREARRQRYLSHLSAWEPSDLGDLARLLHRLNETQEGP